MKQALIIAGLGQLALALGSLGLPRMLGLRDQASRLRPLVRELFWTHAGYILVINACFGLLSAFGADLLLTGAPLARIVSGFIGVYWAARLAIQFAYFDRRSAPQGAFYRWAERGLVSLFVYLTAVYGWLGFGWSGA